MFEDGFLLCLYGLVIRNGFLGDNVMVGINFILWFFGSDIIKYRFWLLNCMCMFGMIVGLFVVIVLDLIVVVVFVVVSVFLFLVRDFFSFIMVVLNM